MARAPAGRIGGGRATGRRAAAADPVAVLEAAARGEAPPVLLVTGGDYFSRDGVLVELKRSLVPEGLEGFNYAALSGEGVCGDDLVAMAQMLPMGGTHRLIVVRRADRIREKDADPVAAYAGAPSASTCLVLVFDQAKAALITALKKGAVTLDFKPPRDYQLARWLDAQAARLGIALDADAGRALADLMGENYIAAMSELQRAAMLAPRATARGGRPRVTRAIVEDLAARGRDTNPFHLGDAVLGRDPARAIGILRDLHDAGSSGYLVLGLLESQLRRFLDMRARVDAGEPARAVVQSVSPTLPPDVKARLVRQLESFDEARLVEAFRIARETDRAIKGYGSGAELGHMEAMIWRICAL